MLISQDARTGEYLVTREGQVLRFRSRTAALAAARDLRDASDEAAADERAE